jgi:hypothetical protein
MDFNEVVMMAQDQVMRDLISGKNFDGLGSTARLLVITVANPANENAQALHGRVSIRTHELFSKLVEECQEQFVMDILGFGWYENAKGLTVKGPMTPQKATERLVEKVYSRYAEWAKEGAQ